ncbi:MAG: hypothetical protein ACI9Z3_001044 [Roseivirga sp.]|jgi:hypothetical protein
MNVVKTINIDYIKPSRTIETVMVSNNQKCKILFVYNYEGTSFRVFLNHLEFINFFNDEYVKSDFHFNSDDELDKFLIFYQLN